MPQATVIRILVVDDDAIVRDALGLVLSVHDDLDMVGEAADGQEALDLCPKLHPDVVLIDLKMPIMDGPTAIAAISQRYGRIKCLVLSAAVQPELIERALRAGAFRCLRKGISADELTGAIHEAYRAGQVAQPA